MVIFNLNVLDGGINENKEEIREEFNKIMEEMKKKDETYAELLENVTKFKFILKNLMINILLQKYIYNYF